jgi:hypothetical protein
MTNFAPVMTAGAVNQKPKGQTMNTTENKTNTTPAAKPTGIKKLNLGGIAQKSDKPGKEYPVLPDPNGEVAQLVGSITEHSRQVEALEGALNVEKAELTALAKQFYFDACRGKTAVPSSVSARAGATEVLVTFQNRYKATNDDEAISRLLGDAAAQYFHQSFELRINGDEIPEAEAETLIGELQELFARHNASAALSAKAIIKPTKEFHTARHTAFAPEQNLAIDKVVPVIAMVKTKLGKGGE